MLSIEISSTISSSSLAFAADAGASDLLDAAGAGARVNAAAAAGAAARVAAAGATFAAGGGESCTDSAKESSP